MALDKWLVRQIFRFFVHRYGGAVSKPMGTLLWNSEVRRIKLLKEAMGSYGRRVRLHHHVRIQYPEHLHVGNNVALGEFCYLMAQGGIHMGDMILLAPHVIITTASHEFGGVYFGHASRAPVTIHNNVWIGTGAILLPGITVGDNAIIAAGAVVREDVPADKIVGGVPAKVLRAAPQDMEKRRAQAQQLEETSNHIR